MYCSLLRLKPGRGVEKKEVAFVNYIKVAPRFEEVYHTLAFANLRWSTFDKYDNTFSKDVPPITVVISGEHFHVIH